MSDVETISKIVGELLVNLKVNNRTLNDAVEIISLCMELVDKYPDLTGPEKSALVIKVLEEICKGQDGVVGTSDDLIPKNIMDILKSILSLGIVQNIIDQIIKATKGQLNINNVVAVGKSVWNYLGSLFSICSRSSTK